MNVIIVGAGQVGFHIAERLSREGHGVVVVELNTNTEQTLAEKVNALVVHGSGADAAVLEEAGIHSADMFIAVTDQDEVNIVACIIANQYKVPKIIARVKSGHFTASGGTFDASSLGIDLIINPESVVSEEIINTIGYTAATEVAEFADGRVIFLGYPIQPGSELAGLSLGDIGLMQGVYRLVVTAIARGETTIVPRGDDVIQEGDIVYLVCHKKNLPSINYLFGIQSQETREIFVLGAGRVGATLAARLSHSGYRVKVIDRNPENAARLAQQLEHVLVLNTEGTDTDTLRSEGIENADAFVAVTQDDQANILCSLLAKKNGAKRAIALVNQQELIHLAPSLGVDASISPRMATAGAILKYVRKGEVLSMAMVEHANAEVLELAVGESNSNLRTPLAKLHVPRGANIGAIVRGDDVIIPGGKDEILPGDHIIVFALPEAISSVENFFAPK